MESPGTAPGSEPCIMGAFIAIVRVAPDTVNIGARDRRRKALCHLFADQIGHPVGNCAASLDRRVNHIDAVI